MITDFTLFLKFLKLGALLNIFFFGQTFTAAFSAVDPRVIVPARVFFAISAYRCLFPVRYKGNIVFHKSPLSSIFITRVLATFSEIALIFQLAIVLQLLNSPTLSWVEPLSSLMVALVVVAQVFVWSAILSGNNKWYFYEEIFWFIIYLINAAVSLNFFLSADYSGSGELLIILNIVFGLVYLPWQILHLRSIRAEYGHPSGDPLIKTKLPLKTLKTGLDRSIQLKNQTTEAKAWGGLIGGIWMAAYWASLLPLWVYLIILRI